MKRAFLVSVRLAALTIVVFGMLYPLTVWGVGSVVFLRQSSGSVVAVDGRLVGSRLIGQRFESERYFHGRPSAAGPSGYDAMASGPSNFGPTNRKLADAVGTRVSRVVEQNPGARRGAIPVDLVTSSGSGLDPDISPDSAYLQVARVARERKLPVARIRRLVSKHVTGRQLGFLGEPRVNVLELNVALDALSPE